MPRIAALQMTSGPNLAANLAMLSDAVAAAVQDGAEMVISPEMTTGIFEDRISAQRAALPETNHPALETAAALARHHQIILVLGSIAVRTEQEQYLANRCYVFDQTGTIVARYDKIHLFDAVVGDGRIYRESDSYRAGEKIVLAPTPWGTLGLSICFDLRFPHHYRQMAQSGAKMMVVPAAFTVPTGQAHWEILLRARAIETGSFIIAPAQTGNHGGGRQSWGHSMIIDPWGTILAQLEDQPGWICADLDLSIADQIRQKIPTLTRT